MINHQTLPLKHNVEPGTTKPFPLPGQLAKPLAKNSIIVFLQLITVHRGRDIDQQAGFPFAQPKTFPGMGDRQTFGPGL
jgi:hypothetical protein